MPTHKKGHDKDKYYHLAKDQGYRSRAAFKLIQINKRFDFLSKSRVLIDLCAAPGGWCQVAAKFMPKGSIIIGVDLLPIRAIRDVKTFVSDITTAECRKLINSELHGWKADVVLCDGAPNIGAAYSKDAYVQNELVLAALKTATDHLVAGGTFCTKVYRSVDYNSIIWVFQQLFEDVQAIKPSSSRSQSSEIFIICQKYTAPNYIDPKLLDPNHVFKEVSTGGSKKIDVLHKKFDQHNKRSRSGYDENLGVLLHVKSSVTSFIMSQDPIRVLTDTHELIFTEECETIKSHPDTSNNIIECLKDLRLLNKSDFKKLLKWRNKIRADLIDEKVLNVPEENVEHPEITIDNETKIENEILQLQIEKLLREKRDKKKDRKIKSKERQRLLLGMSNNAFEETGNDDLFNLKDSTEINDEDVDAIELDEDFDNERIATNILAGDKDLDVQLEEEYQRYLSRVHSNSEFENQISSGRKKKKSMTSMMQLDELSKDDIQLKAAIESSEDIDDSNSHDFTDESKDSKWFSNPIFKESNIFPSVEVNEDIEDDILYKTGMPITDKQKRHEKRMKIKERNDRRKLKAISSASEDGNDSMRFTEVKKDDEENLTEAEVSFRDMIKKGIGKVNDNDNHFEVVQMEKLDDREYDSEHEDYDEHDRIHTLALGTLMINSSRKKAIIDSSYNRYSWNDPKDLPEWFLDDEMRHNKPQIPVPTSLVDQIKNRFQSTGTNEIKKVAEARMRKRKRALTKLKNARKKATTMAENSEMSERQKVKAISQALKTAKIDKPGKVYVVAKQTKGGSSGTKIGSGKGKLKFVDKRMKKDRRGEKAKTKKKRRK